MCFLKGFYGIGIEFSNLVVSFNSVYDLLNIILRFIYSLMVDDLFFGQDVSLDCYGCLNRFHPILFLQLRKREVYMLGVNLSNLL